MLTVTKNRQTNLFWIFEMFQTNVGPIVLSVNPYRNVGNPLTLSSTRQAAHSENSAALGRVVQEAIRLQSESGYPQAVIVSGASGSGKTHASMVLLRQLFDIASGILSLYRKWGLKDSKYNENVSSKFENIKPS